jgi:hypothetical protein
MNELKWLKKKIYWFVDRKGGAWFFWRMIDFLAILGNTASMDFFYEIVT